MAAEADEVFIRQINEHMGIAGKVSRLYFSDPDEQADARQEMMFQLWKSYSTFDGRSKFSTWMYRVCLNTALTYRRKTKPGRESLTERHMQIAEEDAHEKEETFQLLFRAIAQLSPLNKAVVLLYLEDLSYEEIAGITGLTKTNVSVRLVRIRKELEVYMKKQSNVI
jgi:RNA polymerase sigma factor (sigma-70 family)